MKRHLYFILIAFIAITAPAFGADDCPAGVVKHPPLTALDDVSMLAGYKASFEGQYGFAPSLRPGSGKEDGFYWISVSNHYGLFSDGVCRAGWSAYWEAKLLGSDSAPPSLGDQPARYRPETVSTPAPPIVNIPPPIINTPPPASCDQSAVLGRLEQLQATCAKTDGDVLAVGVDLHEHRLAEQTAWAMVRHFLGAHWTEIAALVGGVIAGRKVAQP